MALVYLDSSAIVKLVRLEPQSRALFGYLRERPDRVTSVVATVEVPRAIRRVTSSARALRRADRVLARIGLVELDEPIRARAAALEPSALRSLDAMHLATVLELGGDLDCMVTYDERQARAARTVGLQVLAPS